jgi:uncharacterized membrane protein
MQLTPLIAVHMTAALAALATGPVALWARLGYRQRPRLHRTFGIAWVALMLVTAGTAAFIRDFELPNLAGFTPIHLLVPVTLGSLVLAFRRLARGDRAGHGVVMRRLYFAACVVAGGFTLLPQRYLGHLVWGTLGQFAPIVTHTPVWVWGLLAALLVLGWMQSRDRTASLAAVCATPVAMTLFSLWSTLFAFGRTPLLQEAMVAWLLAAALTASLLSQRPARAWYDRATRSFELAGSWLPMALFLSVFLTRYVVAVLLALHPGLPFDRAFTLPAATLYGVFSGLFLGRVAQLWRLASGRALVRAA